MSEKLIYQEKLTKYQILLNENETLKAENERLKMKLLTIDKILSDIVKAIRK